MFRCSDSGSSFRESPTEWYLLVVNLVFSRRLICQSLYHLVAPLTRTTPVVYLLVYAVAISRQNHRCQSMFIPCSSQAFFFLWFGPFFFSTEPTTVQKCMVLISFRINWYFDIIRSIRLDDRLCKSHLLSFHWHFFI